jgi:hypothetical protein
MSRKTLVLISTSAVSVALFFGVSGLAASASSVPTPLSEAVNAPLYQTNANGQTYGSAAGVAFDQRPDLILAVGQSATGSGYVTGYVLKAQLDADTGADVTTPAEALAWDATHTGPNAAPISIPVYANDGTTVLGTATIQPAQTPTFTTGATAP